MREQPDGRLALNRDVVAREERLDGKYLIHTSDQQLSTKEVALGYRQLYQVEPGWWDLKQELKLRPMFHRREDRVRAHILLRFLVDIRGSANRASQIPKPTAAHTQLFAAIQVPSPNQVRSASSSDQPVPA